MDPFKVASLLLDIVISLIGLEKAKAELSQRDVQLANVAADAGELAKFGKVSR